MLPLTVAQLRTEGGYPVDLWDFSPVGSPSFCCWTLEIPAVLVSPAFHLFKSGDPSSSLPGLLSLLGIVEDSPPKIREIIEANTGYTSCLRSFGYKW